MMFLDVFDAFWALWNPIWVRGHLLTLLLRWLSKLAMKPFSQPAHAPKGCHLGLRFLHRVGVSVRVRVTKLVHQIGFTTPF